MIFISTFLNVLNNIWPYMVAILMFLLLIVIHEFGHFIAAKICKVKVNEFAVGFGPKLFKKQWGETLYSVNLVPLGGYCAMEGEDEESIDERAFCKQSPLKRLFIVANGAIFNLILGLIIVAISLIPNTGSNLLGSTTVAKFEETATSVQYGLEAGDKIISVNGRRVFTDRDLSYTFTNVADGEVDLVVKRNGEKIELNNVRFETEEIDGINVIKFDFWLLGEKKTFLSVLKHTFATTFSYCRIVWFSLIDLLTGRYGISAMSGPVGITAAVGEAAKQNILNILPIMSLITVNLGIFNLLPLPALDGGRILFILIELIARKPVPQKYEGFIHAAGFVLLIGLMIIIAAKDIIFLFMG